MAYDSGPQPLAKALAELIQRRGYARAGAQSELETAWKSILEERFVGKTRPVSIKRGVLTVHVASAVLVSELSGYYRKEFVARLAERYPRLAVKDIKFRLESGLGRGGKPSAAGEG